MTYLKSVVIRAHFVSPDSLLPQFANRHTNRYLRVCNYWGANLYPIEGQQQTARSISVELDAN
jgi:hypothetical protein